jgi:ribosomal protein S27AE
VPKKLKCKAKPQIENTSDKPKSTSVHMTRYRCKECGDGFERIVLETDEGSKVIKHWTKSCSRCGSHNLKIVEESVSKEGSSEKR